MAVFQGKSYCQPGDHAVHFYNDDNTLCGAVCRFVVIGAARGEPAVIIATPEHRALLVKQLEAHRIDVIEAQLRGALQMLDAEELLDQFMVGDVPDPELFRAVLRTVFEKARRGRRNVMIRTYGELVDVLWRAGKSDAAIRLEILWNELAASQSFALLCGYSMGSFYKEVESHTFEDVCRHHTHVFSGTSFQPA